MNLGRFLTSEKRAQRARSLRRAYPVHFYVGRNGSGKSHLAIYDTLPDLDSGRPVLSTVRLLDYRDPRPCSDPACPDLEHASGHLAAHPSYIPLRTWPQFLDFSHGVVLLDEVTGVADSLDGAALPGSVANKLAQMRRDELAVRITGLNFIRANKRIREATNAVTRCESFMPVTVQGDDGQDRIWRQRQLSVARTYDARSLPIDDHTDAAYDGADLLVKARLWIPDSPARLAYDTYAPVNIVGSVTDAGRCAYCAGTRRAMECDCHDYVSEKSARRGGPQARSAEDRTRSPRLGHGVGAVPVSLGDHR